MLPLCSPAVLVLVLLYGQFGLFITYGLPFFQFRVLSIVGANVGMGGIGNKRIEGIGNKRRSEQPMVCWH